MLDPAAKKTALRMIPYGLFIMTARKGDEFAIGTMNWISQCSFEPPLVMIGVKADSHLHSVVKSEGAFAINVCGHDQKDMAGAFFHLKSVEGNKLNGYEFADGETGSPLLTDCPSY